jgi:hypothetical protein
VNLLSIQVLGTLLCRLLHTSENTLHTVHRRRSSRGPGQRPPTERRGSISSESRTVLTEMLLLHWVSQQYKSKHGSRPSVMSSCMHIGYISSSLYTGQAHRHQRTSMEHQPLLVGPSYSTTSRRFLGLGSGFPFLIIATNSL